MEHYLNYVPAELQDAVMSLSKKQHWAIYLLLLKEGEKRFNEIKDHLGSTHSPEIDRALKALCAGGVVEKVAHDAGEIGNPQKTGYAVSETGRKFLECLGNMLSPAPRAATVIYHPHEVERIPIVMERGKSLRYRRRFEPGAAERMRPQRKSGKPVRKSP